MKPETPSALFDSLKFSQDDVVIQIAPIGVEDYQHAKTFLHCYRGSQGTYNAYRRELERFLHWSWSVAKKSIKALTRADLEQFIEFCLNPPASWIGVRKCPKFLNKDGLRIPNPEWRPFVVTISKAKHRQGERPDPKEFALAKESIKEVFAILSTFYNYLIQEEYAGMNPIALIRQKGKFIRSHHMTPKIRRLNETQWLYVVNAAKKMASVQPELHERTLFIMSALYGMYLRISELAASNRWIPQMNDFQRDHHGNWWFKTVGKGNKERQIAVSDDMLNALKRYRKYLGLSALPTAADNSPLIPRFKGKGPVISTTYIRDIVQSCFDYAIEELRRDNLEEDADALIEATVHWLRHTGISDDVRNRPREHVRDDAGHSSGATTDRYIDVGLNERHATAKKKLIEGNL